MQELDDDREAAVHADDVVAAREVAQGAHRRLDHVLVALEVGEHLVVVVVAGRWEIILYYIILRENRGDIIYIFDGCFFK